MRKNVVTATLRLTEAGLKRIKEVPVYKNMLHQNVIDNLVVGDNTINLNHTALGNLRRMSDKHVDLIEDIEKVSTPLFLKSFENG